MLTLSARVELPDGDEDGPLPDLALAVSEKAVYRTQSLRILDPIVVHHHRIRGVV